MKALVTGDTGFVGTYLKNHLLTKGYDVRGFNLRSGQDIRLYEDVRLAIDTYRPDYIFHTAALAYVPESFADPYRAFDTNLSGSLNILRAVKEIGLKTHIQFCGTSEEYGDTPGPITEDSLPRPLSPYAIAKLGMTQLGLLYAQSYDMNVVITRAFNHTGPGRGEQYAEGSWAKQIAMIEKGKCSVLTHGNLAPIRNYTDVRDIVKAYELAIHLPSGIYNICSLQNVSMELVLQTLIDLARVPIKTMTLRSLMRPADFSFAVPNCDKFTKLTGWQPEIVLEQTLNDILKDWREKL